jgi:c-di-GMP-binding flagellar brake protein YcgR
MIRKDMRRHQRVLVPGAVEIRVAGNGEGTRVDGVATVIGLGGMFVRTKMPPPLGSVLRLTLACPLISIESECTVRHITENGMGIEFTGMTPENEEKLKIFLHQLRV